MLKLLVTGICGKMGGILGEICPSHGAEIICGVDKAACESSENRGLPVFSSFDCVFKEVDAIIDFSSPSAIYGELEWAQKRHIPVVIAATGYSERDLKFIRERSKENALFFSANYSLGITLLKKLVYEAAEFLGCGFDIEIVEKHHRYKKDAPSGTALALAESANKALGKKSFVCGRNGVRGDEIGVHSVRGGTIVGEHEVIFAGEDEIITLSHTALSKKIFAVGAVEAAKWICGKPPALYGMEDMLDGKRGAF